MQKISKILTGAVFALVAFSAFTLPTFATQEVQPRTTAIQPRENASTETDSHATFKVEEPENVDAGLFWFGKNLIFMGNNVTNDTTVQGLSFSLGNQLLLESQSEYGFALGNIVKISAETNKDLFVAGNIVTISKEAKIGRDVFASAYNLNVEADLSGDLAVAASKVVLKNVTISGNVNLSVEEVVFEGEVTINGTLTYNDDARVIGLNNATYGKLETYIPNTYHASAAELWFAKLISILSLFVVMVIVLMIYPRAHERIAEESTSAKFAANLVTGLGVIVLAPILAILLLLSVLAAPAGVILLAVYLVILYLSQAFAGAWLGHVIIEKAFHSKGNIFIEALLGIVILGCLSMIPTVNVLTGFLGMLLGAGLIFRCLRPRKTVESSSTPAAPVASKTAPAKAKKSSTPKKAKK